MGNKSSHNAFDGLSRVDLSPYSSYSQPVRISQNNTKFIFIMPTQTQKWLKYDTESNKFMDPEKYPISKPKLMAHSSTIDHENKQIYILDGKHQLFMILDAKKADVPWIVYQDFSQKCGPYPAICYLTTPFNEFHVIGMGKHLKWDETQKDFVEIYKFNQHLQHSGFVYVSSQKRLFLMGGIQTESIDSVTKYVDSIYVANYIKNKWKWDKLKQIELPHKMGKFGYILYEDKYIILFGGEIAEKTFLDTIYVLDVDNYATESIYQWIPVDQICPEQNIYFAVQNQDKIHLFERKGQRRQWAIDINKFTLKQRSLTIKNERNYSDPTIAKIEKGLKKTQQQFEENEEEKEITKSLTEKKLEDEKKDEIENEDNEELENEINSQNDTIIALQNQLKHLQNELEKAKNEKKLYKQQMEQEQKRLIGENQILKEQNKKLRMKCIETSLYREWNTEDVIYWILSLENGRFIKYKDQLTKTLMDSETNGNDLSQVLNEYAIKLWGITDGKDQNCLLNHIRLLCEENRYQNMKQLPYSDNIEGVNVVVTDQ